MLKINMEFRKGVLFVRLNGELTHNTTGKFNKIVTKKIEKGKISTVVFNIDLLKDIDIKGINCLFYIYEMCYKENGKVFLNGGNIEVIGLLKKMKVYKYMHKISSELEVFDLVEI